MHVLGASGAPVGCRWWCRWCAFRVQAVRISGALCALHLHPNSRTFSVTFIINVTLNVLLFGCGCRVRVHGAGCWVHVAGWKGLVRGQVQGCRAYGTPCTRACTLNPHLTTAPYISMPKQANRPLLLKLDKGYPYLIGLHYKGRGLYGICIS